MTQKAGAKALAYQKRKANMPAKRMKRLNENGELEETRPFDLEPDEFIDFIERRWLPPLELNEEVAPNLRIPAFHTHGGSIILFLEHEAIEALADQFPELPRQPVIDTDRPAHSTPAPGDASARFRPRPPPKSSDTYEAAYERWRSMWAREALYHVRFEHPRAISAALGILTAASQLRGAVEAGHAEKAAAYAMLVAFEAMRGGYGLELHALKESNHTLKRAKELAYKKGVGQINNDLERARESCIRWAAAIWATDPQKRMGEVVVECRSKLKDAVDNLRLPKLEVAPTTDTVRGWLIEAGKAGRLFIPPDAQRPGAPKRKPK
jgi:hypothetical protein